VYPRNFNNTKQNYPKRSEGLLWEDSTGLNDDQIADRKSGISPPLGGQKITDPEDEEYEPGR